MKNMSYCRFTNTLRDLRDCYENMDKDDLYPGEEKSRIQLIKMCGDIFARHKDELEDQSRQRE